MSYSITYRILTHLSETGETSAKAKIKAMHVAKMNK